MAFPTLVRDSTHAGTKTQCYNYPSAFSYQFTPCSIIPLEHFFFFCRPLNSSSELKGYLLTMYAYAAQYSRPPWYPVNVICRGIDGATFGSDILSRIYSGVAAYTDNATCKVNGQINVIETTGWGWQVISHT